MHLYGGKHHKEMNTFQHGMAKPVHNFIPNEEDPNWNGHIHNENKVRGKTLVDANSIKMSVNPRGLESLQYGWGKGMPSYQDTEPSDIARQARNGRSLESLNNLDFSNYYKATK